MGECLVHGDDRIEQNLEIGTLFRTVVVGGGCGCQMSACRASLYAYLADSVFIGIGLEQTHGLMQVIQRNLGVAVGQTVLEHGQGYALIHVPLCHVITL